MGTGQYPGATLMRARRPQAGRLWGPVLPRAFYDRPTLQVAADLLGKVLVHRSSSGLTAGIVVEAEAYIGDEDPACHAAPGLTQRNAPMFGEPGHAYVYLNYGVHPLFNIVTETAGTPAAVLIRALEPIEGLELMKRRRARYRGVRHVPEHALCRGPGNLARAMGITLRHNRIDLCGTCLYVCEGVRPAGAIVWSPRIGISVAQDRLWRCFVEGSRAVSGSRG